MANIALEYGPFAKPSCKHEAASEKSMLLGFCPFSAEGCGIVVWRGSPQHLVLYANSTSLSIYRTRIIADFAGFEILHALILYPLVPSLPFHSAPVNRLPAFERRIPLTKKVSFLVLMLHPSSSIVLLFICIMAMFQYNGFPTRPTKPCEPALSRLPYMCVPHPRI